MMKRFLVLMAALLVMMVAGTALGDEVFTVTSPSGNYATDRDYLRISCPMEGEAQVTVTITDANDRITYQRNYGLCSGTFRSEDIYLRLQGSETVYGVKIDAGSVSHSFRLTRTMPRLKGNAGCSVGYPLEKLSGTGGWKSVTLLDLNALSGSSLTVPLHASGAYELGTVTFSVSGGKLTVKARIDSAVDGEIDSAKVYIATTSIDAQNLGTRSFSGMTAGLNEAIRLGNAPYAAVYVKLTVSFDPVGVPGSPATTLNGQAELWQQLQQQPALDSVG